MAFINQLGATGTGMLDLGGYQNVVSLSCTVITLADLAHAVGSGNTRRLFQQGRIGISTLGGGGQNGVIMEYFIEHDAEARYTPQDAGVWANKLYWVIEPGGVVDIEVVWP